MGEGCVARVRGQRRCFSTSPFASRERAPQRQALTESGQSGYGKRCLSEKRLQSGYSDELCYLLKADRLLPASTASMHPCFAQYAL